MQRSLETHKRETLARAALKRVRTSPDSTLTVNYIDISWIRMRRSYRKPFCFHCKIKRRLLVRTLTCKKPSTSPWKTTQVDLKFVLIFVLT